MRLQKLLSLLAAFGFLTMPLASAFADTCTAGGTTLCNPLGYNDLWSFLQQILKLIVEIVFPVIVLFIIMIGLKFITAQGKPEEIQKAQSYFFWALIGSLVVLGAEALSYAIKATVGQLQAGS